MMSQKHLATGSACPPLAEGVLRIYSMRFCPYAERTRLVLEHLKIPNECVNINLKRKPEWFFEKNPLGLVPVLEKGNRILYESAICSEFLDDKYGKHALITADPYEKAKMKIWMERFSKVSMAFYGLLKATPEERQNKIEEFYKILDVFEVFLSGKYFGGEQPSMMDLHIWPWFERFPLLKHFTGVEALPAGRFPKLTSWVSSMHELPAVKSVAISTELHAEFLAEGLLKDKEPNYDLGLEA